MLMKDVLNRLYEHNKLSKEESKDMLTRIASGDFNDSQVASFMTVFMMRSISVEELEGFRDAMLSLCKAVDLSEYHPVDVCGTGGDGKDTFNISTISSFVVAGAGVKVVKHGNYAVSSACGSSNVIEHFGYKFTNDKDILKKKIEEAGICYLHAPLFHPAMKNVAPVRKELGVKTFFNMLGPMVNPAFPTSQLVGVFSLELERLYGYLYQNSNKNFVILHALDGYDEVSLTGPVKIVTDRGEKLIEPEDLGFQKVVNPEELSGGNSVDDAAKILINVLEDNATPTQKNVVIANAGLAIYAAKPEISLEDALAMAKESIESGKAKTAFEKLMA